jgi:predicted NAD/FAD-dependent oxidoreductase
MNKKIAVIGAGLAGITFAYTMKDKFNVKIFEKSRGVGGRMSTRKETPYIFDHGAQFFKIKTNECKNFFSPLFAQEIIQPWSFKLAYFEGNHLREIKIIKNADKFYVGVPNMDSILKYISRDCNVVLETKIKKIKRKNGKWEFYDQNEKSHGIYDWVILTLPAEQSLNLISNKISFYPYLEKIKMKGCYSLMVGINKSLQLDFDAAFIEKKDIAWLALNDSKPSRMKTRCLLINSSYEYATKNINTPKDKVLEYLLNISSNLINYNLFKSSFIKLHQWRYAEAECSPKENYFIDHENKIAICGDWLVNSRVEGAFLSANELSKEIA